DQAAGVGGGGPPRFGDRGRPRPGIRAGLGEPPPGPAGGGDRQPAGAARRPGHPADRGGADAGAAGRGAPRPARRRGGRPGRAHLLSCRAEAAFRPDTAYTPDDYVAVQALVAAGLGVTTLPGLALAAQRHDAVRVVPLPGQQRRVDAAVYGEPPDPPATAALL